MELDQIISNLALKPHPEGGYFKETYRYEGFVNSAEVKSDHPTRRNFSTGIYFLLTAGNFSAFHRIQQDEMWHFYLGAPIELTEITPEGKLINTVIGSDLSAGEKPQYVVPGGNWFASRVLPGAGEYSLAGCTVSPGFDFADFEMASRTKLSEEFPHLISIVAELTRI